MTVPAQSAVDELLSHYGAGNLARVEQLAEAMTRQFPDFAFGWKVLGAILSQTGKRQDALAPMRQAARLDPGDPQNRLNLAITLNDLGLTQEAVASCREAVRLKPDYVEAHGNLGSFLHSLGHLGEAETAYRAALSLRPDQAEMHANLGDVVRSLGRAAEAEAICREAIRLKPNYAPAHRHLGNALRDGAQSAEAEAAYREAIRLKPDFAHAHHDLGNLQRDLGQLAQAQASLGLAIRLDPGFAEAHCNFGNTLKELGQLTPAEASYREAIRLKPDSALMYTNLGDTLKLLGRYDESLASCREAVRLDSGYAAAYNALGNTLTTVGRLVEAEEAFREAIRLQPDFAEAHSNLLFALNYVAALPVEATLKEAKRFGAAVSAQAVPKFSSWHTESGAEPEPTKLRVGFVSGDLREHPVGYFAEGLIRHLDPAQFELVAFPTAAKSDALTERLRPHFRDWVPLYGKSDLAAATAIHQKGIHVLIDLSGHTAYNRLPVFSYKPAPVQLSWLGYFATTGLPEMDYFLGDPHTSPENEAHHFTEQVCRLPDTWLCLAPSGVPIPAADTPALKNGYVTFGSFGNLSKMGTEVVDAWADILCRLPHAMLFLKAKQLHDADVAAKVRAQFAAHGIAGERLILEGAEPRAQYLESYRRVDMVLDTFPYPGGTTSFDALQMGVPILTLKGDRFLSHLGESIAHNAKHADCVATGRADYASKVVALASDLRRLVDLRQTLRDTVLQTPLFDIERFARNAGEAFWRIYKLKKSSRSGPASLRPPGSAADGRGFSR